MIQGLGFGASFQSLGCFRASEVEDYGLGLEVHVRIFSCPSFTDGQQTTRQHPRASSNMEIHLNAGDREPYAPRPKIRIQPPGLPPGPFPGLEAVPNRAEIRVCPFLQRLQGLRLRILEGSSAGGQRSGCEAPKAGGCNVSTSSPFCGR